MTHLWTVLDNFQLDLMLKKFNCNKFFIFEERTVIFPSFTTIVGNLRWLSETCNKFCKFWVKCQILATIIGNLRQALKIGENYWKLAVSRRKLATTDGNLRQMPKTIIRNFKFATVDETYDNCLNFWRHYPSIFDDSLVKLPFSLLVT